MEKFDELDQRVKKFVEERNWRQFHTPSNLAKSISIESSELLECFQWDNENFNKEHVEEELADVFIYCIQLSQVLGVDIIEIANNKMEKNAKKYPVEKAKNSSKKYNEL